MDVLRFLAAQDNKQQQEASATQKHRSSALTPFTVDRFASAFPVVAPVFSKEMCVNVVVVTPQDRNGEDESNSNNNNNNKQQQPSGGGAKKPMTLADQIRAEERAKNNKEGKDKEEKQQANSESHDQGTNDDPSSSGDSAAPPHGVFRSSARVAEKSAVPAPFTPSCSEIPLRQKNLPSSAGDSGGDEKNAEKKLDALSAARDIAMRGRASGYAARGGRRLGGALAGRGGGSGVGQQGDGKGGNDEQQQDDDSSFIEVFQPTLMSDFKKSVSVDQRMPFESQRAFHSLMSCVYSSVLQRDRPDGVDNGMTEQQLVGEKAVVFYAVQFAWRCHQRSSGSSSSSSVSDATTATTIMSSPFTADDDAAVAAAEKVVRSFMSTTFTERSEEEESKIVQHVLKKCLAKAEFLLWPLSHTLVRDGDGEKRCCWNKLTATAKSQKNTKNSNDDDDDVAVKLCTCAQIPGRLENLRWLFLRKAIDSSDGFSAHGAVSRVLEHWDPLSSVMKKIFPLVFKEWFVDASMAQLAEVVASSASSFSGSDGASTKIKNSATTTPMSLAFAKLIAAASGTGSGNNNKDKKDNDKNNHDKKDNDKNNHIKTDVDALFDGVSSGEQTKIENNNSRHKDCSTASPGGFFCDDNNSNNSQETKALSLLARDVLLLRSAGLGAEHASATASTTTATKKTDADADGDNNATSLSSSSSSSPSARDQQQLPASSPSPLLLETFSESRLRDLCLCVFKWWAVLLKEQCPSCSQKVF